MELELKFKNITKSTKDIYNQFLRFHNKKFGKKELLHLFLFLFFIAYFIVFNIKNKNYTYIIILIAIALIAGFVYKVIHRQNVPEKELKSKRILNQEEIIYNFYNLFFEVIRNNKKQSILYRQIYRVYQDENNFYFYIDATHALLVDKRGFVKGNLSEFKEFISKRCIFKYNKLEKEKNS